jgi:hypothetical protein
MSAQRLVLTALGSARARIHCQRGLARHRSAVLWFGLVWSGLFRRALFYFLLVSTDHDHATTRSYSLFRTPCLLKAVRH